MIYCTLFSTVSFAQCNGLDVPNKQSNSVVVALISAW